MVFVRRAICLVFLIFFTVVDLSLYGVDYRKYKYTFVLI